MSTLARLALISGLVTPVYARIGRKLVDSIRNPTVVRDPMALTLFSVRPQGVREIIAQRSLTKIRICRDQVVRRLVFPRRRVQLGWRALRQSDCRFAGSVGALFYEKRISTDSPHWRRNRLVLRQLVVASGGFVDLLFGGVGVRRSRRDPEQLQVGDTLDFWRVEAFEKNKRIMLAAEMKLPGRAWLEFVVEDKGKISLIRQTAIFDPIGVAGLLYWYGLYPLHKLMFGKMLHAIAAACQDEETRVE